jgi:serine/threonine protein kinase
MQTVGGRYALDGRLGEGGMGQVYRARHLQLGKPFALKIIAPAFAEDGAARARFNEEARLASEISHPNIVSVVDFGEDPQFGAYMVMELVEGEPLIAAGVLPMTPKRALDVLAQVADALDHIHKRGIVHGDVKAENIMLTAEPAGATGARRRRIVRLLDFGLARRDEHVSEEGTVSGSPHYLAPERAAGGAATVITDIYALGILGYLLFAGSLPFDGTVMEILMAQIHQVADPLVKRRGEVVDGSVEQLILRAMAKDPAQRHQSAAAFRYELNTVMDMLDMGRRRAKASGTLKPESMRDATVREAFERSRLPQALICIDGTVTLANKAFAKLVGNESVESQSITETPLASLVPGLMRAVRSVHMDGKPTERRARIDRAGQAPLELTLWLFPLPLAGQEVHLFAKIDEAVPPRKD